MAQHSRDDSIERWIFLNFRKVVCICQCASELSFGRYANHQNHGVVPCAAIVGTQNHEKKFRVCYHINLVCSCGSRWNKKSVGDCFAQIPVLRWKWWFYGLSAYSKLYMDFIYAYNRFICELYVRIFR
jgi:hypothetical protein